MFVPARERLEVLTASLFGELGSGVNRLRVGLSGLKGLRVSHLA